MSKTSALRVEESEHAPYYSTYIAPIADQDVSALLVSQAGALDSLSTLSDTQGKHRYGPDKWSVKEVVGHIADSERVFAYRMMRIARGDSTPLPAFDQQAYVDGANFDALPIRTLIDGFRTTRAATLSLMAQIEDEAWPRMGAASGFPVSARALAYITAGHAAHHIEILRDRYGVSV